MSRPRRTRTDWAKIVAAIAAPVVITVGVLTAIALGSRGGRRTGTVAGSKTATSTTLSARQAAEQAKTQAWQQQVDTDFKPMTNDLIDLLQQTQDWRTGKVPSAQLTALIDTDLPHFTSSSGDLARQAPYPPAVTAVEQYRTAAQLYIEAVRVERVATTVPSGPLQNQLDFSFRRLRELGDRVYDQGTADLKPLLPEAPSSPDVEIRLPPDVPDWAAEGLGAGPPLDSPPPPAANPRPEYQQTRSQQSNSGWERAVEAQRVPPATDLASAIDAGDLLRLQQLSDRFVAVAKTLDATADPRDQRQLSTRLRLGLLIDAESARVAQAALLIGDPGEAGRLDVVARRLALMGDSLWPPSLGVRRSGFDANLLSQTGP